MYLKAHQGSATRWVGLTCLLLTSVATTAWAQAPSEPPRSSPPVSTTPATPPPPPMAADKGTLEIYGFGQADAIADFK